MSKASDPLTLFEQWFEAAKKANSLLLDTMSLATWSQDKGLANRIVLFKGLRSGGFSFFTNYQSRKAHDLAGSGQAALIFYWPELKKQIRIEGNVTQLKHEESDEYFQTRPRESQISAWASKQSQPAANREELDDEFKRIETLYEGKDIPCPPFWGGFVVKPARIEFWEARDFRLHDRLEFKRSGSKWVQSRLWP